VQPVTELSPAAFVELFEGLQEGLYVGLLGPRRSTTLAANKHLIEMFGWPADTPGHRVRPLDLDRFVDPDSRATLLTTLARDGAVRDALLRLRREDGAAMWIEMTARAVPRGGELRIEALMRDVTDRQRLQDQSRDLYQQLAQSEKLAALGQTMSGVAHELNNPLATILACAERLNGLRVDEATKRDLAAIHNAAERAARIVRNLQTFARKRHTTRSTVDLNQVVQDTLALRTYGAEAGRIALVVNLAESLPPVFVDPHQIQQILLNLLINAEQAMLDANGQGTLMVATRANTDDDVVIVEVSDDGPGVPEDLQARIFDPFFTTKPVGRGTGLGLSVAYAIAQEHGGQISVSPRDGGGSTFRLELPISGLRVRTTESVQVAAPPPVPRGTRALVVEDEAALGDAVAAALADEGFKPDRASDGEEALARMRECYYDVIICDLLQYRVGADTPRRQAPDLHDGRRGRHRRRTFPRRVRLPVGAQAVQAQGSRTPRTRDAQMRPQGYEAARPRR
jgi:PAS domain S-box-containing protein